MLELIDGPHVLRASQFTPESLYRFCAFAKAVGSAPWKYRGALNDVLAGVWLAEPSSRTRMSTETALREIGAVVIVADNMKEFSSVAKGESLRRSIELALELDMKYLAIRWDTEGIVDVAAEIAGNKCIIINLGDGPGEHPTQMLLDMYTLIEEFGTLDRPLRVLFAGDIRNSRTIRSDVNMLVQFPKVTYKFLSPQGLVMRDDLRRVLATHGCTFEEHIDVPIIDLVRDVDAVYLTRAQKERQETKEAAFALDAVYRCVNVTEEVLNAMPDHSILMHPLPSGPELPESLDHHPKTRHIKMMRNGLIVRRGLFVGLEDVRINLAATRNRG